MAVDVSAPITLRQLEDHLWAAADLFRNKVSNQKDYILALLFFKRASDVYAEKLASALEQLGEIPNAAQLARDQAFHDLQVPEGHSWEDVRNTDVPLMGDALNKALAAIGRANPKQLAGVFERTDFNNKMALPSEDLAGIVSHFHALGPLTSDRVPADVLGQAYEWLIAKFAAAAGKGGGEFYTPAEVGQLCAALLEPAENDHIYDPTCGSGGLLLQCLNRASEQEINARSLFLYGQELNPETWAIARMNMLLHGAGDAAEIKLGDTLAAPAFLEDQMLRRFDKVVANPPFSSKNWGHERLKKAGDPFGRIKHLPPKSHGELAFVQHMVASLNDTGKLAVVLPNGVFFRQGPERDVRKDLVEADLVEAVVQLPVDLFYGAMIPACVLICNRAKAAERRGKVLFVDASLEFERRETKNALTRGGIQRVAEAFAETREEERFSASVAVTEIAARDFNLTVRRYVSAEDDTASVVDAGAAATELLEAIEASRRADERVVALLEELKLVTR